MASMLQEYQLDTLETIIANQQSIISMLVGIITRGTHALISQLITILRSIIFMLQFAGKKKTQHAVILNSLAL